MLKKTLKYGSYLLLIGLCSFMVYICTEKQSKLIDGIVIKTKSIPMSPTFYRAVSAGFNLIIADTLWFEVLQKDNEKKWKKKTKSWLYYKLNTIVNLDPEFRSPYEFGALFLSVMSEDYAGGKLIIEKAIKRFPLQWKYPAILGYTYIYEQPDLEKAQNYFSMAAKCPNAPLTMAFLASRLSAKMGKIDFAISTLVNLRSRMKQKANIEAITYKINVIMIEKMYVLLDEAVKKFRKKYRRKPSSIDELILKSPDRLSKRDPLGGTFYLDKNGAVANTKNSRLIVGGYDKN